MKTETTYTVRAYSAHGACFADVSSSEGHEFTVLRKENETPAQALVRYAREERSRARVIAERAATYEAAAAQAV